MSTWKMYTKPRIANCTQKPVLRVLHSQTTVGLREQNCTQNHRILVLQCPMTVGLQEQNILKLPRSSGTLVLDFLYNTGRSTFKHQTHHLSTWQFNRKEKQNNAKRIYDRC